MLAPNWPTMWPRWIKKGQDAAKRDQYRAMVGGKMAKMRARWGARWCKIGQDGKMVAK